MPLKEKLLSFVIQLPPSSTFNNGFKVLKNFVGILDTRYKYALEVRDPSWFNDEVYAYLRAERICLIWNQLDMIRAPPIITTDFLYLRLIGDRSIDEKDFGKIQKDRTAEIEYWAKEIEKVKDSGLNIGIVAANNHYAGFGPSTVNIFRKLLGLPAAELREPKQASLADFNSPQEPS